MTFCARSETAKRGDMADRILVSEALLLIQQIALSIAGKTQTPGSAIYARELPQGGLHAPQVPYHAVAEERRRTWRWLFLLRLILPQPPRANGVGPATRAPGTSAGLPGAGPSCRRFAALAQKPGPELGGVMCTLPSLASIWFACPPSAAPIAGASSCGADTAGKNFISEAVAFVFSREGSGRRTLRWSRDGERLMRRLSAGGQPAR